MYIQNNIPFAINNHVPVGKIIVLNNILYLAQATLDKILAGDTELTNKVVEIINSNKIL